MFYIVLIYTCSFQFKQFLLSDIEDASQKVQNVELNEFFSVSTLGQQLMDHCVDICIFQINLFFHISLTVRFASLPRIFVFLFRNVTFVTSSEKCFQFVPCTFSKIGLFQKKINLRKWWGEGGGGLRAWNFQGYQRNGMQNFQRLVKKDMEFPEVIRKILEFPEALVFGSRIFKGYS